MEATSELRPFTLPMKPPRHNEQVERLEPISEVRDELDVDALNIDDNEVSDVHGNDDA